MRPPQGFEWLLILFIILLLFGAKRLPDMARGVGRSLRILKAETRSLGEDDGGDGAAPGSAAVAPPVQQADPQPQPQRTDPTV